MLCKIPILYLAIAGSCVAAQEAAPADQAAALNQAASNPIAYVYVSNIVNPNSSSKHDVYAFSAAANGSLTRLAGSPFPYDASGMAAGTHYLFALNGEQIDSYALQANGSLRLVSSIDAAAHADGFCGGIGPLKLDHSGQDVYNAIAEGDCEGFTFQTFAINKMNGKLVYKGSSQEVFLSSSELDFVGNDMFAFTPICTDFDHEEVGYVSGFKRASDGSLTSAPFSNPGPTPKNTSNSYCPFTLATDPTNHMAALQQEEGFDGTAYGTPVIATYSVTSTGKMTTTSAYQNMPHTRAGSRVMRMAPSGNLLAVGGTNGLELFLYNGASPSVYFKTLLTSGSIQNLAWDKNSHLYATEWTSNGNGKLYVFTVTSTGVSQDPGSPYSIPNPDSLVVRSE
ncbi:MAG TPA: hypothetical protein VGJ21_17305 [Terracidiphilus sp.]|jgi:hypothetical protein